MPKVKTNLTDEERREKKNKRSRELYKLKGRTRTQEQLQAHREKAKERYYRLTHEQIDARREYNRKYARATYNPSKMREWRKKNREHCRLKAQQYRKNNKDRIREYDREWKKKVYREQYPDGKFNARMAR